MRAGDGGRVTATKRVHLWVSGVVQGVFYRANCAREAEDAGVRGWVRNLADGRVEAVFEGDGPDVERMLVWARSGSPEAVVEKVEVRGEVPQGDARFEVLPTD